MQTILIVDDEPMNHEVIHAFLDGEPYTFMNANSGEHALRLAKATPPDLVLLDVMMPGLSGFETARLLKEQTRDEYLPIILVTALGDQGSRVLGLGTHADEFLTKPVDREELLVRMRNLLTLRSQKMDLLRKNIEHVELHRFKDELSAMIVHDLKNPISAMLMNLQFVLGDEKGIDPERLEALRDVDAAAKRAMRLIHNLLDAARIEADHLEVRRKPTDIGGLITQVIEQHSPGIRARGLTVTSELSPAPPLDADGELLWRVIENLLDNALRYAPSSGGILVGADRVGAEMVIRVGNTGTPIPQAARKFVFEKFGQVASRSGRMNLGLGLYFCRLAVEAHGGRIWVDETPAFPTVFNVALPLVVS